MNALRTTVPALVTDWETRSLPIGGGALGGGVFGTVAKERIQLDEKTPWTGGPGSTRGYDFGDRTSPRLIGADQDGGQRLTGAVDPMAVLPVAPGPNDVPNRRSIAFG